MPLNTAQAGGGPGPALASTLRNANTRLEVQSVIARITVHHIFGGVGGVAGLQNVNGWRVDRQNAAANEVNLSVQKNGVRGQPSTVATVFVPNRYNIPPPGANATPGKQDAYRARLLELQRKMRQGLVQSFASTAPPLNPPNANARVIDRFEVRGAFSA